MDERHQGVKSIVRHEADVREYNAAAPEVDSGDTNVRGELLSGNMYEANASKDDYTYNQTIFYRWRVTDSAGPYEWWSPLYNITGVEDDIIPEIEEPEKIKAGLRYSVALHGKQ